MRIYISYSIAALIVLMLLFGVLAARKIDRTKTGALSEHSIWLTYGPLVPEEILTQEGQQWARLRNICAALALGGATLYGIVMAVMGKWH
jgi:hypothetical protein